MRKDRVIIVVVVFILMIFIGFKYFENDTKTINVDADKFKNEYEALNDKVNESNNKKYPEVKISSNNPVKYSSYDEIFEILKSGTGVIFLGFPECPWCRNLVPTLIEAAKESEIKTIYYLNISEDRNLLILNDKNEVITQKEGNKNYFKLVDLLSDVLDDYVLSTADGESVNTNTKRIYLPLVIFVKNGKIVSTHVDTVSSQEDPYVLLTDRQQEELLIELINKMSKVNGNICDESC